MPSPARDPQQKPIGRLLAAWRVLRGESLTPPQVMAQWIEYQLLFDGILDKLNTALARLAKRDQRTLAKQLEVLSHEPESAGEASRPISLKERKAALRSRAFGSLAASGRQPIDQEVIDQAAEGVS